MIKLSASAIQDFKACPQRFYLRYVLGIYKEIDTKAQRIGSLWHTCLEILGKKAGSKCQDTREGCIFCRGEGIIPDNKDQLIVELLNEAYNDVPYLTAEEIEQERIMLLYSLAGYKWFYEQLDHEVIYTELPFELPIKDPETGRILLDCYLIGKIDKIIRLPNGLYCIKEHKTTSKSVDSGSSIWSRLGLNTQKKVYIYAAQQLQQKGIIKCGNQLINNCFYDYFHKPTIKPKKLSKADSKKFIETGEYCGQKFEIDPDKKEKALVIQETPEMYGARLLQDMTERPNFYFAEKEIACDAREIKRFEYDLYNILRNIQYMEKYKSFYAVESQCEATFKCPYTPFCYNSIFNPDIKDLPDGFKHNKR